MRSHGFLLFLLASSIGSMPTGGFGQWVKMDGPIGGDVLSIVKGGDNAFHEMYA